MTRIAIPILFLFSGAAAASEPQMVAKSAVIFDRAITSEEVKALHAAPGLLQSLKGKK